MRPIDNSLTRIGVFYDGQFFSHISNYYLSQHERRARISISGLHQFIRNEVAREEGIDVRYAQIVDAHYFRGRLSANQARDRGEDFLHHERRWDEILMREGVVTHYLPLGIDKDGNPAEKGIDVWLALEAFELAMFKRFSVSVILAGDGDYVPLVRKLNTLGTRVMLLGWDLEYTDASGRLRSTRTNQNLINEVTYPVMMSDEIEGRGRKKDPLISGLFVARRDEPQRPAGRAPDAADTGARHPEPAAKPSEPAVRLGGEQDQDFLSPDSSRLPGTIFSLHDGFGFIKPADGNGPGLFFHRSVLQDAEFNELAKGMRVRYVLGTNDRGPCATSVCVGSDETARDLEGDSAA